MLYRTLVKSISRRKSRIAIANVTVLMGTPAIRYVDGG